MGKIKVRKKLRKNKNVKISNISIYSLVILSILFVFLVFLSLFTNKNEIFEVEPRNEKVEKIKEKDTEQYKTVGWIRVQGTNIDYPLINITDEEYGQPVTDKSYAWTTYDGDKLDNKVDIASHNILNLSSNPVKKDEMFIYFEELMNFVYYDFAKENQFIQLNVNGKDYIYKIFSVNFLKTFDVNRFSNSGYDVNDIKEFIDVLNKGNLYEHNVDVNEDDKLISLYTCSRFFGNGSSYNFAVTGRLLRDDEKVELSKIDKTDKYEEILDIMKGGEENE